MIGQMEFDVKHQRPRFEWVTRGEKRGPSDVFDIPLYADDSAVAVPSVGSLVPGWVLIVPKKAEPNLAALSPSERRALQIVRSAVRATLEIAFDGHIYEFEHGAKNYGGPMGCGVDQAHLHVVPLQFDFLDVADALDGISTLHFESDVADPWGLIPPNTDYWLIRDAPRGNGVIIIPRVAESQALRRLIARQIGSSAWDYKRNPLSANAGATHRAFSVNPNG